MARSGAGAGESSAVREASRGIEASDDAYPCPLCAKASGVTAVTGTRPCCACPGQRIASRRQDPGSHARWPRSWTRSGPPAPSGGSGPSIPPSSAPRPSPCAELWAGGPWGPPQDRPRKLTLPFFSSLAFLENVKVASQNRPYFGQNGIFKVLGAIGKPTNGSSGLI
jgi:hypothetical protein